MTERKLNILVTSNDPKELAYSSKKSIKYTKLISANVKCCFGTPSTNVVFKCSCVVPVYCIYTIRNWSQNPRRLWQFTLTNCTIWLSFAYSTQTHATHVTNVLHILPAFHMQSCTSDAEPYKWRDNQFEGHMPMPAIYYCTLQSC